MKRTIAVTIAVASLPLLVACSGGSTAGSETGAPTAPEVTSAAPGGSGGSGGSGIVGGDEFCDLAVEAEGVAQEVADLTESMTTTIATAIGSGDVGTINAWGSQLAGLSQQMLDFYANGRPYIEGEDIEGAWDLMEQFTRDYALAVANEAATTTDTVDFTARMGAIVTSPELQAAVNFSPAAAERIGDYVEARCGTTSA